MKNPAIVPQCFLIVEGESKLAMLAVFVGFVADMSMLTYSSLGFSY